MQKELSTAGSLFKRNYSSDNIFQKYEINQPAGAQDAASASSSEASAVQVATDTVPQILMSILHLCDPTVLASSRVIGAHFTQQAQKINIPILSFKYIATAYEFPKKTQTTKPRSNAEEQRTWLFLLAQIFKKH